MDDDTGSEETGSELRDDQTDTSSAEVPSARPRRAVTLRSSSEPERRPPMERARRARRVQATPYAESSDKGPAAGQDAAEVQLWALDPAGLGRTGREHTLVRGLGCGTPTQVLEARGLVMSHLDQVGQ